MPVDIVFDLAEQLVAGQCVERQVGVGEFGAFRLSGGAGGVEDDRGVARVGRHGGEGAVMAGECVG
jgi:hypothetical protein